MTARRSPFFPALLTALALAAPAAASPQLHVDGPFFKDAQGRVVILRGVNVAGDSKVPPFRPAKDPDIFTPLSQWGMNTVRLLFTWEAYEPEPGVYDASYLDYYATAAQEAWMRGLYVIVDFHQDGFSRYSIGGCGEGFPKWAIPPEITPAEPDNGPDCDDWGQRMSGDTDMLASWTAFYADKNGVRTRYLEMVKSVAARLDQNPGVIGYDLLNEPWGDEATELASLHADAAKAVREASPSSIIFISPRALTSSGLPTELPPPAFDNAAYAPHYYAGSIVLFKSWSGEKPTEAFETMTGTAKQWNVPLFLGEFGAPAGATNGAAYVDTLYDAMNGALASGAQWVYTPGWTEAKKDGWNAEDFSIVDGQGATRDNFHVRPYPSKIAGVPTRFVATRAKDPKDSVFELEWENDPAAGATEIYLPVMDFFGTPSLQLVSPNDVFCDPSMTKLDTLSYTSPTSGPKRFSLQVDQPKAPPAEKPDDSPSCGLMGIEMLALWPLARIARRRARKGRRPC